MLSAQRSHTPCLVKAAGLQNSTNANLEMMLEKSALSAMFHQGSRIKYKYAYLHSIFCGLAHLDGISKIICLRLQIHQNTLQACCIWGLKKAIVSTVKL